MRMKCVMIVFVLVIMVSGVVPAQDGGGKLVFAIRKPLLHQD